MKKVTKKLVGILVAGVLVLPMVGGIVDTKINVRNSIVHMIDPPGN